VNQPRGLILDCLHDFRVAMTGRAHGHAGVAVEKDVAINVSHPNSCAAFSDQFEVWPRVRRIYKLRVSFNDCASLWTGKLSLDFRSFRCDCGGHHFCSLFVPQAAACDVVSKAASEQTGSLFYTKSEIFDG
jgi:hypothetical protein